MKQTWKQIQAMFVYVCKLMSSFACIVTNVLMCYNTYVWNACIETSIHIADKGNNMQHIFTSKQINKKGQL